MQKGVLRGALPFWRELGRDLVHDRHMPFDFDAAVCAPFRMQPGLRRMAPGAQQLTPLTPGSRHQREKLAVLSSSLWPQALCAQPGFDAAPALAALCAHAAAEQPAAFAWDGQRAQALRLSTAAQWDGQVEQLAAGSFGLGDEVSRCLLGLPPEWRLAGLLSLAFAEDFAVVDATTGTLPFMAVALPSHWAPQDKVGHHFSTVHGPVADNQLLLKASDSLLRLVTGSEHWERFVWTITDQPRLRAHPAQSQGLRWQNTAVEQAWFRSEHQTFIPLPAQSQAVFTIHIEVQPLVEVTATPGRAQALHDAVASMSAAVLTYRGLHTVREPLLAWLAANR
jgi:dimethylamine monooxygenase subunit A